MVKEKTSVDSVKSVYGIWVLLIMLLLIAGDLVMVRIYSVYPFPDDETLGESVGYFVLWFITAGFGGFLAAITLLSSFIARRINHKSFFSKTNKLLAGAFLASLIIFGIFILFISAKSSN